MSTTIRSALYAILAALTPLVVAYGLMTDDIAGLWVALIKAVADMIALVIAGRYVPTGDDSYTPQRAEQ